MPLPDLMDGSWDSIAKIGLIGGFACFVWWVWQREDKTATIIAERERRDEGLCAKCGYDLQGGHENCPECGTPTAPPIEPIDPKALDFDALRDNWPANFIKPEAPWPGAALIAIHETEDRPEADLLSRQINARGVWSRLDSETTRLRLGASVRDATMYFVTVTQQESEHARLIMDGYRNEARIPQSDHSPSA